MTWKDYPIYKREDSSFVIIVNEAPYHVPDEGEWVTLYTEVDEYYNMNESSHSDHEITWNELHPEPEIELTPEEQEAVLQKQYTDVIQQMLDVEAQKLGYDNCNSVCTYIDTGVQKFDDEGKAFRKWRSAVWAKGYEILDAVNTDEMEIPTQEELIAMLPVLVITYSEEV